METLTRFGLGWLPVVAQTVAQSIAMIWNELPLTAKMVAVPSFIILVAMVLICRRKSTSFGFRASLTRGMRDGLVTLKWQSMNQPMILKQAWKLGSIPLKQVM
jgi:hypothetical protein